MPELGLSSSRMALQLAPRIVATERAAVSSWLRCSTIDSTLGGGRKLFFPTFMSCETRDSSCVFAERRQYSASPGRAVRRSANSSCAGAKGEGVGRRGDDGRRSRRRRAVERRPRAPGT